ncbi:uncharacterized protein LY89DRAFT_605365 [Mollisia scopiformis]|uniref:Zn(2)-C6 fungal-type domain-containing protein n=1 Tax=Mollisia scopiformis TaxID=149040 RepID=A0A194XWD9_MOLSC|nr:uncharacterized protein LY89DRAFT_605365 [Mollisia scopiformis]KUJ24615.1 hypothetical protein LY89DRAFT_605365 [Mollisia scopiformis]
MFSPTQSNAAAPASMESTPSAPSDSNHAPNVSPVQTSLERKASHSSPHGLNARSCVTCRRRKVKCDKQNPCSNCTKAGSPCVFPAPGRAPRRPRQGGKVVSEREAELLKRLRRLEGVVEELSGQVEVEAVKHSPSSDNSSSVQKDNESENASNHKSNTVRVVGMDEGSGNRRTWIARSWKLGAGPPKSAYGPEEVERGVGRLVLDEGKSRYVASPFWASISEEVDEIRDMLHYQEFDSDSDAPAAPSNVVTEPDHQSFIMGYNSSDVDLKSLHPLPSQIPFYWQTFLENVQPLVKIMHTPTMNKVIKEVQNNLDSLSRSTEALMFSIYFATITSMNANEVMTNFGIRKETLLKQYRFGVEQALARAGFLNTNEIVTVQAFVLFLVCVRRHDDTRFVWSLTGLALRISQSLGLHRDGTKFRLSPFDTEMRRRLWWQVCILDTRASEDHGSDPSILDYSFDTEYPSNINDDDLDPDATDPPQPRQGVSEMTFCLIRYEICNLTRKITYTPPGQTPCRLSGKILTIEDKERLVREVADHLEKTYLQYCEDAGPLYWVAATVARLIIAKMSLIIYHPLTHPGKLNSLSQDIRDRLFMASIEIIEYSRVLESEASTKQWGWLFHTYIQWHAIAYILGELCIRPNSTIVERAWRIIDLVFTEWNGAANTMTHTKTGMLWQPMRRLLAKAMRKREENIQSANNDTDNNGLGIPRMYMRPPPEAYSRPSPCPGNIARDRLLERENQHTTAAADMSNGNVLEGLNDPMSNAPMYSTAEAPAPIMPPQVVGGTDTGMDNLITDFQPMQPWVMDENANNGNNGNMPGFNPYFPGIGAGIVDLDVEDMADVSWEGWDEMVRDYLMEQDQAAPDGARGPTLGGMGQWW